MTQLQLAIPSLMGRNVWSDFFDDFLSNPTKVVKQTTTGYPVTDIFRDLEENQVIEMALAGFTKESITVETQSNQITIRSEGIENRPSDNHGGIARRAFKKTFIDYNNELELSNAKVTFVQGLLRVVIPMKEAAYPKQITIE